MYRFAWLALLLAGPLFAADNPIASADEMIRKAFPADKPGVAVAIVQNGQTLLLQGYGLADVATKKPITADTAFDLASVSKQFTASAILMLVERGKLRLDDPVTRWVPGFTGPESITLRHLLHHTSGLPDYIGIFQGNDEEFSRLTCHDVAGIVAGKKLRFEPGTKHEYSNTNYALLPVVVERASGKSFAQFMRDYVFVPSGMSATRVMDRVPYDIEQRATGYGPYYGIMGKLVPKSRDGGICGDGNVFSTARDMVAWNAALDGGRLLRPETLQQAWSKTTLADGKPCDYGFGWVIAEREGRKTVWHNGGWAGTHTLILRRLTSPLTIIMLSNDERAGLEKLAQDVAKLWPLPSTSSPPAAP